MNFSFSYNLCVVWSWARTLFLCQGNFKKFQLNSLSRWMWWLIVIHWSIIIRRYNIFFPSIYFCVAYPKLKKDHFVIAFVSAQKCIDCIIINRTFFDSTVVKHTHYPVKQVIKVPEHIPAPYPVEKVVHYPVHVPGKFQ